MIDLLGKLVHIEARVMGKPDSEMIISVNAMITGLTVVDGVETLQLAGDSESLVISVTNSVPMWMQLGTRDADWHFPEERGLD